MTNRGTDQATKPAPKRAVTYVDGQWLDGNPPLMGPMTHAVWMASVVFDGARAFDGVMPDLDRHADRLIDSAKAVGLAPPVTAAEVDGFAREGVARFEKGAHLYIRPMIYAEDGWVAPDPASARFIVTVFESPMPDPSGLSVCLSTKRRPTPETAPTAAKASALYPQAGLALTEAARRGFQNAVMLDALGNVAELATANLFLAKDGIVKTPVPNGTFLDGITRQRAIALMRHDGLTVIECRVSPNDLLTADELFSTGNHGKVLPITRYEDRDISPGPIYHRLRTAYWDFAHSCR